MSDTQRCPLCGKENQWVPVSERLPEDTARRYLVMTGSGVILIAFIQEGEAWSAIGACSRITNVTHWMDLPEPPTPADPFDAWWDAQRPLPDTYKSLARAAWNAAKEHYAKPLPDFETWWSGLYEKRGIRYLDRDGFAVAEPMAREIWNAAQGKPEA